MFENEVIWKVEDIGKIQRVERKVTLEIRELD